MIAVCVAAENPYWPLTSTSRALDSNVLSNDRWSRLTTPDNKNLKPESFPSCKFFCSSLIFSVVVINNSAVEPPRSWRTMSAKLIFCMTGHFGYTTQHTGLSLEYIQYSTRFYIAYLYSVFSVASAYYLANQYQGNPYFSFAIIWDYILADIYHPIESNPIQPSWKWCTATANFSIKDMNHYLLLLCSYRW